MPTKMTRLTVNETSGVDHPAHLHEGWAVMKAADPTVAKAAFAALGKKENMTVPIKATPRPAVKALSADDIASIVEKAIDSKLQPILDSLGQNWQDLRAFAESESGDTPTGAGPAAADAPAMAAGTMPVTAAVGEAEALEKALATMPAAVRTMLEKSRSDAAEAVTKALAAEKVAKAATDELADEKAIAKAATDWSNIALTAEVVKSVRRLEQADPELHKATVALLTATNAQLDGSALVKELGQASNGTGGETALQQVTKAAQVLVDNGEAATLTVAKSIVFERQPELATAVREGK